MPSFGTCFGKRRVFGITSIGILRVFLETEVHSSFPLMHWRDGHVAYMVYGSAGRLGPDPPDPVDDRLASNVARKAQTTERLKWGIGAVILLWSAAAVCSAQSLAPSEALDRYLARSLDQPPGCSGLVFAVQIDASLPKLKKRGRMSGLRLVSRTGQIFYRGLRFTGDNLVKTAVIARFLAQDAEPPDKATGTGVTRQNYSFTYDKTSDYNGLVAYVYRLKPKRKRVGLFKGELWLTASTAAPLRLWGDFVKSPSIFIRSFRFVEDYQNLNQCFQPLRLLLTVQTRMAGGAEMAVWLHPVNGQPVMTETGVTGSDSAPSQAPEH
jgi:hypothetical protein